MRKKNKDFILKQSKFLKNKKKGHVTETDFLSLNVFCKKMKLIMQLLFYELLLIKNNLK